MAGPIKIAILADAAKAKSGFAEAGAAADAMGRDVDDAGRRARRSLEDLGDSTDTAATTAGTASGAFGALASGLELAGIKGGALEGVLMAGQLATDAFSGAADFATLALQTQTGIKLRNTVSTIGNTIATTAANVATKAWAGSQLVLNAVLTANPIGLVIVAIVALVAVFVLAYNKSETFRKIVNAAFNSVLKVGRSVFTGLRSAALAAFGAISSFVSGAIGKVRAVISSVRATASGVWSSVRSSASNAFSAVRSSISNAINSAKAKIGEIRSKASATLGSIRSLFSGSALIGAGERLIGGLIQGIRNKIGQAVDVVQSGLQKIKNLLPGSPIKSGPLKSWNNGGAGKRLIGLLSLGVRKGSPGFTRAVSGALRGSTSTAGLSLSRASSGAATGSINVYFNGLVGDPAEAGRQVLTALNKYQLLNGKPRIA